MHSLAHLYYNGKIIERKGEKTKIGPTKAQTSHEAIQLKIRAALQQSKRCIPVKQEFDGPTPRSTGMVLGSQDTPDYVEGVYREYERQTGDVRPLEEFHGSRVTGGTVAGVTKALGEIIDAPNIECRAPCKYVMRSVVLMRRIFGWQRGRYFSVPSFHPGCYINVGIPSGVTSGGTFNSIESGEQLGNVKVKYTNKGSKRDLEFATHLRLDEVNAELRIQLADGFTYNPRVYPLEINATRVKVEAKGMRDPLDKNRIMFNGTSCAYKVAKHILEHLFKYSYHRGGNGIGTKWWDGDGQRLANDLEKFTKIFYYDFSRFDQSLKAIVLAAIMASYIMFFKDDGSVNYRILKHHLVWLSDESTIKLIEWPDGLWRIIVGMMMSGAFQTSEGGTEYHQVVRICWLLHVAFSTPTIELKKRIVETLMNYIKLAQTDDAKEAQRIIDELWFYMESYGDDGIFATKEGVEDLNLGGFKEYSSKFFDMTIKYKNCAECTTPYSQIDDNGMIVTRSWAPSPDWYYLPGEKPEIYQVPHGLKYLKEYLVQFDVGALGTLALPFRDPNDFWYRPGRTATRMDSPYVMLIRLYGLMIQTRGYNKVAHEFLDKMADILLDMISSEERIAVQFDSKTKRQVIREYHEWERKLEVDGVLAHDWNPLSHPSSLQFWDFSNRPSADEMIYKIARASRTARDYKESMLWEPGRQHISISTTTRYVSEFDRFNFIRQTQPAFAP